MSAATSPGAAQRECASPGGAADGGDWEGGSSPGCGFEAGSARAAGEKDRPAKSSRMRSENSCTCGGTFHAACSPPDCELACAPRASRRTRSSRPESASAPVCVPRTGRPLSATLPAPDTAAATPSDTLSNRSERAVCAVYRESRANACVPAGISNRTASAKTGIASTTHAARERERVLCAGEKRGAVYTRKAPGPYPCGDRKSVV